MKRNKEIRNVMMECTKTGKKERQREQRKEKRGEEMHNEVTYRRE